MPETGDCSSHRQKRRTGLGRFWLPGLLLLIPLATSALEIQQTRWGFDGQVTPGRFNMLSVLVANDSTAPFDGTVTLSKGRGLENRVGALYAAPCYVSPLTTRWLQFHVYVDNAFDEWRLEWGRRAEDRHELAPPKWGPPAQVFLSDSESPLTPAASFKQFPDDLFPSTVAATTALGAVLLDHAPRWEPARRQAFVKWLRAGGTVHVLPPQGGSHPVFTEELSVLNGPPGLDRFRVGAGHVVRHAEPAQTLRKEQIEDKSMFSMPSKPEEQMSFSQAADAILGSLAAMSQPRHSWGFIFLFAMLYVVVIGPGSIFAGRRLADYRLRLALLLGCVGGFALIFHWIGRRGQDESSVVHTLSYARHVEGDTYNVTQWINVFATRGDLYTITHSAPHNLYATGQDYETVKGTILNGKDGRFSVDIPLYSRRAFLHQAELKGAAVEPRIAHWDPADGSRSVALEFPPDFSKQVVKAWVVQGTHAFSLSRTNGRLECAHGGVQPLKRFLKDSLSFDAPSGFVDPYNDRPADVRSRFELMAPSLIAWSLGIGREVVQQAEWSPADDGRTHLFVLAPAPDSFSIDGQPLGREVGYALYHIDLAPPGTGGSR